MEQKFLWVMVGLPASGKSTKVKELFYDRSRHDVDVLSTDDIIEIKCKQEGITYNEGFSRFIDEATKMFFANFQVAIKEGRSICIDRTNLTKKSRSRFLSQVPNSYKKIAVIVTCPDKDEYLDRLNSREGKNIPLNVIDNMMKTYERPSLEEGFNVINELNGANLDIEEIND